MGQERAKPKDWVHGFGQRNQSSSRNLEIRTSPGIVPWAGQCCACGDRKVPEWGVKRPVTKLCLLPTADSETLNRTPKPTDVSDDRDKDYIPLSPSSVSSNGSLKSGLRTNRRIPKTKKINIISNILVKDPSTPGTNMGIAKPASKQRPRAIYEDRKQAILTKLGQIISPNRLDFWGNLPVSQSQDAIDDD
ncbi:hypothetical protein ILUMI_05223 [Ignelater luminosus]|uniref:Uncharacterized protein n=1 Tax=Ignelater luminosus TaxID=2038154 RepID=A0A8K0DCC5_IGNLU|nr:hypothetical protein ILUMI_05223 [Ignelater luminosus]